MPLSASEAVDKAKELMNLRASKKDRLDEIREYVRDEPDRRVRFLPDSVPREVRELAKISRVNMLRHVVRAAYQHMYLDGFRSPREEENVPAWRIWRANQMGKRQIGVHKAALTYGESYVTVLPGTPFPVMRGVSPRSLTCAWGDDDLWPRYALEARRVGWRLYDNEAVYELSDQRNDVHGLTLESVAQHGARDELGEAVTPVVQYRETDDLDDPVTGLVEPHIPLQDQLNVTTFGLMVAQHYGAFKQRWIIGWLGESEEKRLRISASRLMAFEDSPDDVKIGEFGQTDLKGYIESRESLLRHLAAVSQTSAHELLGQLVNLSAEALALAEASSRRAGTEYKTAIGPSHEQALALAGRLNGARSDPLAEARWRDTESRTLAQLVDALGKAAQMLGVPRRALWDRFADAIGASQMEVQRWETLVEEESSFDRLVRDLDRQGAEQS